MFLWLRCNSTHHEEHEGLEGNPTTLLDTRIETPHFFNELAHGIARPSFFNELAHGIARPSFFNELAHGIARPSFFNELAHGIARPFHS